MTMPDRLTGRLTLDSGAEYTFTADRIIPTPVRNPQWDQINFGLDFPADELGTHLELYPRADIRYSRIFGAWLPSLAPGGKMLALPQRCIRHVSWKNFNAEVLIIWLDEVERLVDIGTLAPNLTLDLSVHHEPKDDIERLKRITMEQYLSDNAAMASLVRNHPASRFVRHVCPILTMEQVRDGTARDFFLPGLHDAIAADPYNRQEFAYRDMGMMIDPLADLGQDLGVPVLFPEVGGERVVNDPTGNGRAAWIRLMVERVWELYSHAVDEKRMAGRPVGFAWWCVGGTHMHQGPEYEYYRGVLARQ